MTSANSLKSLCALLVLIAVLGCSKGGGPVSPLLDTALDTSGHPGTGHQLWGFYDVVVDSVSGTVEAVPVRGAMFNANVVKFLQPPVSPIHLLTITVNPGTDFTTGHLDLDVTIRHPFPGLSKFRGFDVRGIVMGDGSISFNFDSSALRAGPDDLQLLNADGWTRWWNPTEFTSFGTILGYTPGAKAYPGYVATATINAYKYYADALGKDSSLSELDLDTRGGFATVPGINTRRYVLQFPIGPGKPIYKFNYAIDASWALPDESGYPDYPVDSFPPEANQQEAWQVSVTDAGSTAWYVDDSAHGGSLKVSVEVFDWQGAGNSNGVADEVSAIWVDCSLLSAATDIFPMTSPLPGGPGSSVWIAELTDIVLTGSGDFDCWAGVESSNPANYAPQIQGDPNAFDWPDVPVQAYALGSVHVSDIAGSKPEVIKVVPSQGAVSTVVADLQVIGSNFQNGATVEFRYDAATTLSLSNVAWVNDGLITCDADCTGPLGLYDVTVTNPDMQQGTLPDGFEVVEEWSCGGGAHDWGGEYGMDGTGNDPGLYRFDMALLKKGSNAGKALYQLSSTSWGVLDPNGDAGQMVVPFMTTPSCYCVDAETDETTGRIAIVDLLSDEEVWLYDEEGQSLGEFIDPDLPADGNFTAIDFDKDGDMWAATRSGPLDNQLEWTWELRHYQTLPEAPFYEPVPEDTVDITHPAMISPFSGDGIGDLGISFFLNRLFIFVANTADGGSNKITSWDLNVSPPEKVGEIVNPYPPLTRHHIFSQGALSRMNIDVDHRFLDKEEQCRIYAYATIWTVVPDTGLDCYSIRLDGDLNILDTGTVFHLGWPLDWDSIPQCAIINDAGPDSPANLFGCGWADTDLDKWPTPADW